MGSTLKFKHWHIFLIIVLGLFIRNFSVNNEPTYQTIFSITGTVIYFLYTFLIGHELYQLLPRKVELNYNLFVVNSFVWLTAYIIVMILSNGQGMVFHGIEALPAFYVFYALLNYFAFPARTLKSIELNRQATLREYIGDFFLIVLLPIGIWFLQPRVNKIAEGIKLEGEAL
jgi:CDP-diglyceride synthetase